MSVKDIFEKHKNLSTGKKSASEEAIEVESAVNVARVLIDQQVFEPPIVFLSGGANYAKFGSAEKYFIDSFNRVIRQYPYDGSKAELQEYYNLSTYLDKHILENEYPTTTGYVIFAASSWGTRVATSDYYGTPGSASLEYIKIVGGPHSNSVGFGGDYDGGKSQFTIQHSFTGSNLVQGSKTNQPSVYKDNRPSLHPLGRKGTREGNLRTDLDNGVTVEFWLRKEGVDTDKTTREVIFDLWNGETAGSTGYGRLTIEYNATASASPLRFTLMSGTTGVSDKVIGSNITLANTTGTLSNESAPWKHYAISAENSGSNLFVKLYVDGQLDDSQTYASKNVSEITGAMIGYIGALRTAPAFTTASWEMKGWGKLSASLDEFRFWKVARTHEDIGRNWWTQIGGGTNTDVANTELGVYYKFNEGITQTASVDSTVLDYSGRVSNGSWYGYAAGARNTGSAMVSASLTRPSGSRWGWEKEDPILYSFHPTVQDKLSDLKATGSLYDERNAAALINKLPAWIIEDDEKKKGNKKETTLQNIVQMVASYFDKMWHQIDAFNQVKMPQYVSASAKPYSFNKQRVESKGLFAPEIFINSEIIERILHRDEDRDYEIELHDIKNLIYQNIYNNIIHIYKSKGNEKSIRNLLHCFGIDDELVRLNIYANNGTYKIQKNFKESVLRKKYVDFNHTDRNLGTVYQYLSSSNSNTVSYISGSDHTGVYPDLEDYLGATVECEVIFPFQHRDADIGYYERTFLTSSLFGMHTAIPNSDQTNTDTSWASAQGSIGSSDYANFQVFAVRAEKESPNVQFYLTSSGVPGLGIKLTSSFYNEVYDNEKWNLSVRVKPSRYPISDGVSGSGLSDLTYDVHFRGTNTILDHVQNQFHVSTSVSNTIGKRFMRANKRLYVGAHHQDFTSSVVLQKSDVRISSARYWTKYLDNETLNMHALYPESVGITNPMRNAYLLQQSLTGVYVPNIDTLVLNWDFSNVTGSGDSTSAGSYDATFVVQDISSGSTSLSTSRYDWLGKLVNQQHSGRGDFFLGNKEDVIMNDYVHAAKQTLPEYVVSSDMVENVLQIDDVMFTRESRIIEHFFSIEKSMYQNISQEMVQMFSSIVDFNNLVGQPVDRYRPEYKLLGKFRQRFFENVRNTPSLDKFVDFYKWIDSSLSIMILQLIPASVASSDGIQTMVEGHLFERNKYWNKFPTLEMKETDPNTHLFGITEHLYNWKFAHPRPPEHNYAIAELEALQVSTLQVNGRTLTVADVAGNSVTFAITSSVSSDGSTPLNTSNATTIAYGNASMNAVQFADNIVSAINAANTAGTLNTTATSDGVKIFLKQAAIELNNGLPSSIAGTSISDGGALLPIAIKVGSDWNRNSKYQRNHGIWWNHRAERTDNPLTSKNSIIDNAKEDYKRQLITHVSRSGPTLYSVKDGQVYEGSTYALRRFPKIYRYKVDEMHYLKGGVNFHKNKKIDFVQNATLPIGPVHHNSAFGAGIPLNVALTFDCDEAKLKDVHDIYDPEDYFHSFEKKHRSFGVRHGRNWEQGGGYANVKSEIAFPLNIISSSITLGEARDYHRTTYTRFVTGATITNLHNDVYGEDKEKPLQGPFTERWVGGLQSRHIQLNERRPSGFSSLYDLSANNLDSVYTRAENWFILLGDASPTGTCASENRFSAGPGALGFVGPDYPYPSTASWYRRVNPRARYHRLNGIGVKRPLNIANIRTSASFGGPGDPVGGGATIGGNFDKNYQVVHSTGRCVNNMWFREMESASLPSRISNININDDRLHATTHIHGHFSPGTGSGITSINSLLTGAFHAAAAKRRSTINNQTPEDMQITLPKRGENTLNAKNKTIIVNRFSAPGGFEVMSRGYLDVHCEEYSVHNALPFRNLTVRGSGSGEAGSLRFSGHLTASGPSREALNTAWRRHSARFGADPIHAKSFINGSSLGYLDAPTYYRQFHRNSRDRVEIVNDTGILSPLLQRVGTGDKQRYDNAWIRHTLPQNESQYSWISASLKTGEKVYGYASYDGTTTSSYPILDQQITSSDFRCGTASAGTIQGIRIHGDFVGLNTLIRDEITGSYDGGVQATALIILDSTSPTNAETLTIEDGSGNQPVTFTFDNSVAPAAGTATVIGINGVSDLTGFTTAVSRSIEQAIIGGTLDMAIKAAVSPRIALEQNKAGTAGNNIITGSAVFTGEIKPLSFQGGFNPQSNILGRPLVNTERRDRGQLLRYRNTKFATIGVAHAGEQHTAHLPDTFNALMLHRNGPYGYPTFKQIRNHQHQLVRFQHKNKYDRDVMYRASGTIFTTVDGTPSSITYQYEDTAGEIIQETFLSSRAKMQVFDNTMFPSSKDKPLIWTLNQDVEFEGSTASAINLYSIRATYGNDLMAFSNEKINNIYADQLGDRCSTPKYQQIYGIYAGAEMLLGATPDLSLVSLMYSEDVYPANANMYTTRVRHRMDYRNAFWRTGKSNRNTIGDNIPSALGNNIKQSCWPLDPYDDFATRTTWLSAFPALDAESAGELQNNYTIVHSTAGPVHRLVATTASARLNYPMTLFSTAAVAIPSGMFIPETSSTTPTTNRWKGQVGKADRSVVFLGSGYSEWQAGELAGYVDQKETVLSRPDAKADITGTLGKLGVEESVLVDTFVSAPVEPWYGRTRDPINLNEYYDDFNQDLRAKFKDYSIVPEFRISDHMDYYINRRGGNFLADNLRYFENVGQPNVKAKVPQNSSQQDFYKIYQNSDFMKHFCKISKDHEGIVDPTAIKLVCNAAIKFVPYDGFYPAQRVLNIVNEFSNSYGDQVTYTGKTMADNSGKPFVSSGKVNSRSGFRNVLAPLFSPGIMMNSIKAGMAVDYPIMMYASRIGRRCYDANDYAENAGDWMITMVSGAFSGGTGPFSQLSASDNSANLNVWDLRIPFEAIRDPSTHLQGIRLLDHNPHLSASFGGLGGITASCPFVRGDTYKLMIDNFLAETVDFWIEDSELTEIASAPEADLNLSLVSGTLFGARVCMYRSMTKPRLARDWGNEKIGAQTFSGSVDGGLPQDPKFQDNLHETMTISSDAYGWGPPVSGRGGPGDHGSLASTVAASYSGALDSLEGYNGAFQPPYYFGEAWADIIFKVPETKTYTLAEIQERSYIKYWRVDPGPANHGIGAAGDSDGHTNSYSGRQYVPNNGNPYALYAGQNINENVMQISASTNMFNLKQTYVQTFAELNAEGGGGAYRNELSNQWSIQMKWETPHLNFNDRTIRPVDSDHGLTIPTLGSESVPRGIWRQFGLIPREDEGVYLGIEDIPQLWLQKNWYVLSGSNPYTRGDKTGADGIPGIQVHKQMESLVDLLGFDKDAKKLGRLKERKIVKEAIVAVPFIECEGERNFFEIDRSTINLALGIQNPDPIIDADYLPGDSIIEMVNKMKNYVFPPKMDFIKYGQITPYAMYIFEFEFEFDQDDLSYLWQNCAPRDYKSFQAAVSTIAHPLLNNELMGLSKKETGQSLQDKLQWMVFKVKQRAKTKYDNFNSDRRRDSVYTVNEFTYQDHQETLGTITPAEVEKGDVTYDYSYNWPYDYFSFVELIKIDSQVLFGSSLGGGQTGTLTDAELSSDAVADESYGSGRLIGTAPQ